jgi:hypothetical protein
MLINRKYPGAINYLLNQKSNSIGDKNPIKVAPSSLGKLTGGASGKKKKGKKL